MNELKLEAGKFYRTRGGRKVQCLTTARRGNDPFPVVSLSCDHGELWSHKLNGEYERQSGSKLDLISEWVDAPEVDWSLFSPWVVAVMMGNSGVWYEWTSDPKISTRDFNGFEDMSDARRIPPQYSPKWTGPWQQSLVVRPGKEGK
jgi:hypothetical protein